MTETMVERVARAIADQAGSDFGQLPVTHGPGFGLRNMYVKMARAAIEAMRAITEDMEAAAVDAVPLLEGKEARWSWEACIDAALKE